jgi:16S rRNA (uracil1498-N3)-methyltransferase
MKFKSNRVPRIFQPSLSAIGNTMELTEYAGIHVGVVLRMQPGMSLILFCGDNREVHAVIKVVHKKKVLVTLIAEEHVNRESPRIIHLAQGISKGDRMEWVVQKAVELGVQNITPLVTERCAVRLDDERLFKKNQQWQAVAIAACEQSGRNWIPHINPICSFKAFISQNAATHKLLLHPHADDSLRQLHFDTGDISLVIGPEGGLSEEEIQAAIKRQFRAMTLGPRVLRTETAAIAALSVLQALSGDL